MFPAALLHRHLGFRSLTQLTTSIVRPGARPAHVRFAATALQASAATAPPRMGRGGDGQEHAVSSAGVPESIGQEVPLLASPLRTSVASITHGFLLVHADCIQDKT